MQDAALRNLQTLAGSTQRLSKQLKATEPKISRHQIVGFRNVVTHGYLSLDLRAAWNVVERDLPELAKATDRMARIVSVDALP